METVKGKLRRVRRLDSIRLDLKDKTYFMDEGYLVDRFLPPVGYLNTQTRMAASAEN